jgi:hypothetical protein
LDVGFDPPITVTIEDAAVAGVCTTWDDKQGTSRWPRFLQQLIGGESMYGIVGTEKTTQSPGGVPHRWDRC